MLITLLMVALSAKAVIAGYQDETEQEVEVLAPTELTRYATFRLEADLSSLSDNQQEMVGLLIQAAEQMDRAFWKQAYGDPQPLLQQLDEPSLRRFANVNYGPWDRLQENQPFVAGAGPKPPGANFYPRDMGREEFESAVRGNERLKSLYTMVRRDDQQKLVAIDYHDFFAEEFGRAANYLRQAAELAEDPGFKQYLLARADALLSGDYRESDMLWMDTKTNSIELVLGPIETYEDQLFGYKAACEGYVLLKDLAWSERLSKYAKLLPALQRDLPVADKYKQEEPGLDSDLNAYDVVYYAGDCNAGSKTIAINLPNDEQVQLAKGTRRLQLKNAMRAKYDRIMEPIADMLIVEDQRKHVTFDAFFSNTMFHEVAHGLGIKYTLGDGRRVREALLDTSSALEEGKADILGLFMIGKLLESGDLKSGQLEDYYVTFMAGIFRSVRFGASSAHGKANMIRFNFFAQEGAFTREDSGRYRVNMDRLSAAMTKLTQRILTLQGDGDYDAARKFVDDFAFVGQQLQADLGRLNSAGIPTDIVFEQGAAVLGLDSADQLLFDGSSMDGWNRTNFGGEGQVSIVDGHLRLGVGSALTGVDWQGEQELPKTDYELSLKARRVEGNDMFCGITFPYQDSHCSLIVGGWGGSTVGLSCVDGRDAARNDTKRLIKFTDDQWYQIRIQVTRDRIRCLIDDELIVDQPTTGREISIRDDCAASAPLGIFSFQTVADLADIRIRKLEKIKPKVLILGDSISIGYTPHVQRLLGDVADVYRPGAWQTRDDNRRVFRAENCAGTSKGIQNIDRWLAAEGGNWDVIHFNFGLHDLKHVDAQTGNSSDDPEDPHQASPEKYAAQLTEMVEKLQATGAKLIFATTTPVPAGGVRPYRLPADVVQYNRIAREIMDERDIAINDLFEYSQSQLQDLQQPVNVHYKPEGSQKLGERVAEVIRQAVQLQK